MIFIRTSINHFNIAVIKFRMIEVSPHTRDFSHELGDTI